MSLPGLGTVLSNLSVAVDRLSSAPDEQKAYLAALGDPGVADELALEFDDSYRPAAPRLVEDPTAGDLLERLAELDAALADPGLPWSLVELDSNVRWARIRDLARRASVSLSQYCASVTS